jgi:hypothetical protein
MQVEKREGNKRKKHPVATKKASSRRPFKRAKTIRPAAATSSSPPEKTNNKKELSERFKTDLRRLEMSRALCNVQRVLSSVSSKNNNNDRQSYEAPLDWKEKTERSDDEFQDEEEDKFLFPGSFDNGNSDSIKWDWWQKMNVNFNVYHFLKENPKFKPCNAASGKDYSGQNSVNLWAGFVDLCSYAVSENKKLFDRLTVDLQGIPIYVSEKNALKATNGKIVLDPAFSDVVKKKGLGRENINCSFVPKDDREQANRNANNMPAFWYNSYQITKGIHLACFDPDSWANTPLATSVKKLLEAKSKMTSTEGNDSNSFNMERMKSILSSLENPMGVEIGLDAPTTTTTTTTTTTNVPVPSLKSLCIRKLLDSTPQEREKMLSPPPPSDNKKIPIFVPKELRNALWPDQPPDHWIAERMEELVFSGSKLEDGITFPQLAKEMSSTASLRSRYDNEDVFWNACVDRFLSEGWININSLEVQSPFSVKKMEAWSEIPTNEKKKTEGNCWNDMIEPLLSLSREHRTFMCLFYARFAVFSVVHEHVGIPFVVSKQFDSPQSLGVLFSHYSAYDGFWLKKRLESLKANNKKLYSKKKDNTTTTTTTTTTAKKTGSGKIVQSPWSLLLKVLKESCLQAAEAKEIERYTEKADRIMYKKTGRYKYNRTVQDSIDFDVFVDKYKNKWIREKNALFYNDKDEYAFLKSDSVKSCWRGRYLNPNVQNVFKNAHKYSSLFALSVSPIDVGKCFVSIFSNQEEEHQTSSPFMGETLKKTCLSFAFPTTTTKTIIKN